MAMAKNTTDTLTSPAFTLIPETKVDTTSYLIITGPDLPKYQYKGSKQVTTLQEKGEIDVYLNSTKEANVLFIHAHGATTDGKHTSLVLIDKTVLSIEIVQFALKENQQQNVTELNFPCCHTNQLQADINAELSSLSSFNFVLGTFCNARNVTNTNHTHFFIEQRLKANSLIEFVATNLATLAANNYILTVNLDGQKHTFETGISKASIADREILSLELQKLRKDLEQFYTKVQQGHKAKHSDLLPDYNWEQLKAFTDTDFDEVYSRLLLLELNNKDLIGAEKFDITQLLKNSQSVRCEVVSWFITEATKGNSTFLQSLLIHSAQKNINVFESDHLDMVINNREIFKLLLPYAKSIGPLSLTVAITEATNGNSTFLQSLLIHSAQKNINVFESDHLDMVINNRELLKLLLSHAKSISASIVTVAINEAINEAINKDSELLNLLSIHSSKYGIKFVRKDHLIMTINKPEIFKVLLEYANTAQLLEPDYFAGGGSIIDIAVENALTGNAEALKSLLEHSNKHNQSIIQHDNIRQVLDSNSVNKVKVAKLLFAHKTVKENKQLQANIIKSKSYIEKKLHEVDPDFKLDACIKSPELPLLCCSSTLNHDGTALNIPTGVNVGTIGTASYLDHYYDF